MAFLKLHYTKLIVWVVGCGCVACDQGSSASLPAPEDAWGKPTAHPAQLFFASDCSPKVRDGVQLGLAKAAALWGQYGPLEYWVMGTDEEAGQALIRSFCDRRAELKNEVWGGCMSHHEEEASQHNMLSYLRVGQEAIKRNQPSSAMGRNGQREWGLHIFASSYPFGFDRLFDQVYPEEEIKTLFHEYFHAVQHAHLFTKEHAQREALLGPTWFVEGGAEYMALKGTATLWASGQLPRTQGYALPSFRERMRTILLDGKRYWQENCPDLHLSQMTYDHPCTHAAYSLGAWGHAWLAHRAGPDPYLDLFLPSVERLGWDSAFQHAFGLTPEAFDEAFHAFLLKETEEQLAILPDI